MISRGDLQGVEGAAGTLLKPDGDYFTTPHGHIGKTMREKFLLPLRFAWERFSCVGKGCSTPHEFA